MPSQPVTEPGNVIACRPWPGRIEHRPVTGIRCDLVCQRLPALEYWDAPSTVTGELHDRGTVPGRADVCSGEVRDVARRQPCAAAKHHQHHGVVPLKIGRSALDGTKQRSELRLGVGGQRRGLCQLDGSIRTRNLNTHHVLTDRAQRRPVCPLRPTSQMITTTPDELIDLIRPKHHRRIHPRPATRDAPRQVLRQRLQQPHTLDLRPRHRRSPLASDRANSSPDERVHGPRPVRLHPVGQAGCHQFTCAQARTIAQVGPFWRFRPGPGQRQLRRGYCVNIVAAYYCDDINATAFYGSLSHPAITVRVVTRLVDLDDLVDAAGIAQRLGAQRPSVVYDWRRRHPDFPQPVFLTKGVRLWLWSEVAAWAKSTGRLPAA